MVDDRIADYGHIVVDECHHLPARSAAEAFLYRRLESHPETAGRFQLNRELPILFDPNGTMEVDLVCERTRTVIELDGPRHFVDADAYRRDRRKDALLQRHGYLVLRFLSDDVSQRLDDVLDAILTALVHRERSHPKVEPDP